MNQKISETLDSIKRYISDDLTKSVKENWRVIAVAVIVIAVFVNSWGNGQNPPDNQGNPSEQSTETPQSQSNEPEANTPQQTPDSNTAQAKENPDVLGESLIKQTASPGEGVTHLARRTVKEYLNSKSETLGAEQKIYLEDYLVKSTGLKSLEIGQTVEFQNDSIKAGLEKAKNLNEKQIQNLSKFVPLVKNLN